MWLVASARELLHLFLTHCVSHVPEDAGIIVLEVHKEQLLCIALPVYFRFRFLLILTDDIDITCHCLVKHSV